MSSATRTPALWFLNRAAAGITAAAITGVVGALTIVIPGMFDPSAILGGFRDVLSGIVLSITYGAWFGTLFGGLPGILVMCLSPARAQPWRSLPIVVIGTVLGFLATLALAYAQPRYNAMSSAPLGFLLYAGPPTIGGLMAAWLWGRARSR